MFAMKNCSLSKLIQKDVPVRTSTDIAAQKNFDVFLQLAKSHHCKGNDFLRNFYLNFYFFYKGSAVGSSKE